MVKRIKTILSHLIYHEQGAFIRDRSITDNVIVAQEFMHDLWRVLGRRYLMASKLDMERAYD